ncbi:MAG: ATP-binding cassette domain-containing protein [Clostridiales bacterium]|nr:ATP-binding cassette domain-containing protein [Clostridiales bacterium]
MSDVILKAENLVKHYPVRKGMFNKQVATKKVVDGINLEIHKGDTVALVGESGCGKTVLLRTLIGLEEATDGKIYFNGKETGELTKQELAKMRRSVQMIFQNSQTSLHPRFTIQESLEEPLILSGMKDKAEREKRVVETLLKVGLDASYANRYPGSLSGGQRQRVAIARALVETPELILADEPISALDVSLQAQVLNLLMDLKDELNLSMLFVAHDLAVVRQIADYTMIMYAGKIVEAAPAARIYDSAKHPYTKVLLKSAPSISKGVHGEDFHLDLKIGDAPDPAKLPTGCLFHTRCIYADENCVNCCPEMQEVGEGHYVCCSKWKELENVN